MFFDQTKTNESMFLWHLCHWVPLPGKQARGGAFVTPTLRWVGGETLVLRFGHLSWVRADRTPPCGARLGFYLNGAWLHQVVGTEVLGWFACIST